MRLFLIPLLSLLALVGCDQQAMFEKFAPKEEVAVAKRLIAQIAARDFPRVEAQLEEKLRTAETTEMLGRLAAQIPPEEPKTISVVGANTFTNDKATTYNLTLEYEYARSWMLASVVLQRNGPQLAVIGIHMQPETQSLKEAHRFTLRGKSLIHYLILFSAMAVPLFIIYALVQCYRTPVPKRKWAWYLFIAVGLVQVSLNWTDGAMNVQPISFLLLGAGFRMSGPYAPLILTVALPIGAAVFLSRRQEMLEQKADQPVSQ